MWSIQRAKTCDEAAVRALFLRVAAPGNEAQWDEEYPLCMVKEDLESGEAFLAVDEGGALLGYFCGQWDGEEELAQIIPWRVSGRTYYFHRLAVDPAARRQGVGRGLLREAARRARAGGARSIRLETVTENRSANALYQSEDFLCLGEFENPWVEDGCPIFCYEKPL